MKRASESRWDHAVLSKKEYLVCRMSPNDSVDIEIFSSNVFTSVREQRGVFSVLYNQSALYKEVIRVILTRESDMPV